MSRGKAPRAIRTDDQYAWFADGSLPHSRGDRIAEAVALAALVFSLGIGLVIAMLPVSALADSAPRGGESATVVVSLTTR